MKTSLVWVKVLTVDKNGVFLTRVLYRPDITLEEYITDHDPFQRYNSVWDESQFLFTTWRHHARTAQ